MSDSSQEIDNTSEEHDNTLDSSNINLQGDINETSDIDSDDEISAIDHDITIDILNNTDDSNSSAGATISSDISNINLDEFNQTSSSNDDSLLNSISAQDNNSEYQILNNLSESANVISNIEVSSQDIVSLVNESYTDNNEDESKEEIFNEVTEDSPDNSDTVLNSNANENDTDYNSNSEEDNSNSEEDTSNINNDINEDETKDNSSINNDINEDETKDNTQDTAVSSDSLGFKVGYPLTLDAIEKNEISTNISEKDIELLKSLVSPNHQISQSNKTVADIQKLILPRTNLQQYINSVLTLFNKIKYDPIYVSTKYLLTVKIVDIFKSVPVQRYFSKDFLNDEFIDYLIKKHLFYDYILSTILIREWNISYFNFKPNAKHLSFYKVCCSKLFHRLNRFLQNSQYYTYRLSDFTTYISFIKLMIPFISTLSEDDSSSLLTCLSKLFLTVLGQLYSIIHTSKTTLETLNMVSDTYLTRYIDRTGTSTIKRFEIEISKCTSTINRFFIDTKFTKTFCDSLIDFNICNHQTHLHYSEIISVIPSLTNTWNYPNNDISNLLKILLRDNLVEIINCNKVNIHHKLKIISESDSSIFSNNLVIKSLIDYYSQVEKYDENQGFYDKDLIRYYIVKAILIYIYPDGNNTIYNLDKNIVNTNGCLDEKLVIFRELDNHTLCSFITLLISEITDNFNNIDIAYKILTKSYKKDVTHIYKYVNAIENIIINYNLLTLLLKYRYIHNPYIINKYCELINVIINYSFKNRIYCQLSEFSESNYNLLGILNPKFTELVNNFYRNFYDDLQYLINNDEFVENLLDNESLYNRSCLDDTRKLIGFMIHDKDITYGEILDNYMRIIDTRLFQKNQTTDKYDDEIPSEFVDPIYYTPILTPMELPNTKTIVEKKIIMNHLIFNQTNPFDGLPLTREEFIEYNNKDEVKIRLSDFINNFNTWKNKHKI